LGARYASPPHHPDDSDRSDCRPGAGAAGFPDPRWPREFCLCNLAFHTAGQTEWSAAAVNYPVATGASLWTDAEARAEIRIGPDTVDMASNTELDVVALDERVTRFEVPQGRIYLHLRRLDQGQSCVFRSKVITDSGGRSTSGRSQAPAATFT
jgi:hypothetical protein